MPEPTQLLPDFDLGFDLAKWVREKAADDLLKRMRDSRYDYSDDDDDEASEPNLKRPRCDLTIMQHSGLALPR